MNEGQEERICRAFERIAEALIMISDSLEGINEHGRKFYAKLYPERTRGDAIVTTVPSDDDKIREAQGRTDQRPIKDWLSGLDGDDGLGTNEREFLLEQERRKNSRAKVQGAAGSPESGPETLTGQG